MKTIWLFFVFLSISLASYAGQDSVESVNKDVASLQEEIARGDLPYIEINDIVVTEGKPPELKLHYRGDRLIAAFVSVGHETWSTHFSYFFYDNGAPMKFTKVIQGRPDSPPRQGVVYDRSGKVLWKNIDAPPVDPARLHQLLSRLNQIREGFSHY